MTVTQTAQTTVDALPGQRRKTPQQWLRQLGWRHLVGVIAVVYAAFPIVYVMSASVASGGTLTGSNELFATVSWANYATLNTTKFWMWMGNSLLIASITAVGTVLMGASAAYAFSRFRFTGRRAGLTTLLIIQMFPQMLAFVALFLLLLTFGEVVPSLGLDSRLSLICISRRRSWREHLPDVRVLQLGAERRSTEPRRSTAPPTPRPTGRSSCRW